MVAIVIADSLLSVAFTSLLGNPVSQTKPLHGIFTSVCDASRLTASPANSQASNDHLQTVMAGASVLVLLITRADNPSHTEAFLMQMLAAAPVGLTMPLLILTTASDLHQGVQQWLSTLPGMRLLCVELCSGVASDLTCVCCAQ